MLNFTGSLKVFVALEPCDMRKSFNGLQALVTGVLRRNPQEGSLFAFANRRRNLIKLLYWDGTGLWVLAKRLEKGTFAWPVAADVNQGSLVLTPAALALLLDGIDMRDACRRPWYQKT